MNLYRISQTENDDYDTYSDAIVCEENEESARRVHPRGGVFQPLSPDDPFYNDGNWAKTLAGVRVELIGTAMPDCKRGVVCASFHAG